MDSRETIARALERFPRARMTVEPTPIQRLVRLSHRLGYDVYCLREDLTGFALGGNKIRKLEYLIGDAHAKNADAIAMTGACSFTRNAAAAGRVFGLEVHVVLAGPEDSHNPLSRAFFQQFGAHLHYVPADGSSSLEGAFDNIVQHLEERGKRVYRLCPGGSDSIGSLGYVRVFGEIVKYTQESGVHFDWIMVPSGSTGTHVGLLLGQAISGYDCSIVGMAVSQPAAVQRARVLKLARRTAELLGVVFSESRLVVDDRFLGAGYAVPSNPGMAAESMLAGLEGILLDQVYGAKAAAGLLHYASTGEFVSGNRVLFIHTGGNAGLYY